MRWLNLPLNRTKPTGMKTKLLLFLTGFFLTITTYAYTSLQVQDPRQAWNIHQGSIDTAVLSIKPKGAYFEYGLYLTLSSKPYTYSADTFEVQLFFDLPKGAIVTDSWLWVGNQIVQASIMDRNRANIVYEGIVQRRQDPSILYKNSDTQYELRVFPQPANQTRKVKITYLVPAEWQGKSISAPLPLNILKASLNVPFFQVLSYVDASENPAIAELPSVNLQTLPGINGSHKANIPASGITGNSQLNFVMKSPMQNGVFAATYPTGPTDGFYQLVLKPDDILNIVHGRKTAILFDYKAGLSNVTTNEILQSAREMLLKYYLPTDSFNLFFSTQTGIYSPSNVWLPCDTAYIQYTFNNLPNGNPIASLPNTAGLLGSGITFIKQNGADGTLLMLTNSNSFNTAYAANSMISAVETQMSPYTFPINTVSYTNYGTLLYYIGGVGYLSNEYLFGNLANLTGGSFQSVFVRNSTNSYSPVSFNTAINNLFNSMGGNINAFDLHADVDSGLCYAKYSSFTGQTVLMGKSIVQIGKYHGQTPLTVEVSGIYQNNFFSEQRTLSSSLNSDSTLHKMWIGSFLNELESISANNAAKKTAVDSSIHHRVLSLHTAFLALEPSDTVTACSTCVDETNPGGNNTTGLNDPATDSLMVAAQPNPFTDMVTLKITLQENTGKASLKIYNMMGQVVKTFTPETEGARHFTFEWNGTDEGGQTIAAGMYIAILETDQARQTLKLMKR